MMTGFRALAFHTLLSFQGASSGSLSATPLWFPIRSRHRSGGHRISGLPGSSTERPIAPGCSREEPHRLTRPRPGPALQAPTPVRAEVTTVGLPLSIPEGPAVTVPASTWFPPPWCRVWVAARTADSGPCCPSLAILGLWRHLALRPAPSGRQDGHRQP